MEALQKRLGYEFRQIEILQLALTHPSVAHEKGKPLEHNQRLEFLGDAVLQLILTRELFERFPEMDEGALTKSRARLVNAASLAELGRTLGLGHDMLVSRGEHNQGGRDRASTLADTFEAVLGAIYVDGGIYEASRFVLNHFGEMLKGIAESSDFGNPKGVLQEIMQMKYNETPVYKLVSASGPDHHRVFESLVELAGNELGRGTGTSKKASESEAALAALEKLKQIPTPPIEPPSA